MRKFTATVAAVFIAAACSAQWVTLNSTTTNHLRDVDFINVNEGVIVGDAGTILHTGDGGLNWTDINNSAIHGDVYAVTMINNDTIWVSTFDISTTSATVYLTTDGGLNWNPAASTSATNHKFDLDPINPNHEFATGEDLLGTTDLGANWDTAYPGIASTVIMDHLRFADATTGHVSGLISGFATYSATFARTSDGGAHWYSCDVFSFPNSDAFTSMCFTDPDTVYMLMNHYNGFNVGTQNSLVKLSNFNLVMTTFDTTWSFSSQIINSAMPTYGNDVYFSDAMNGFVAGKNGNVYITSDGGVNWTADFTGSTANPMHKMKFTGNTGYAVGDNGVLIKRTLTTGIAGANFSAGVSLYPNPAKDRLVIRTDEVTKAFVRVLDVTGKEAARFEMNASEYVYDASALAPGVYFIEFTDAASQSPVTVKFVKQ